MRNDLLRLGWSHGDDEIISTAQAVEWFDLSGIGRAPARIDFAKLANVNAHYIRDADDGALVDLVRPLVATKLGTAPAAGAMERLRRGLAGLKQRASTLDELAENALFYCRDVPLPMTGKARKILGTEALQRIVGLVGTLEKTPSWEEPDIEASIRRYVENSGFKLGEVAQPLRAALTGATTSPSLFEVMAALGRDQVIARISAASR